jgi:hypothetical protein
LLSDLDFSAASLADEIVLKPAPTTTSRDRDKTDLAKRLACLAFIVLLLE